MPYYEITGMRSHRHPFYGSWGSYAADDDPWGMEDEEKDEGNLKFQPDDGSTVTLSPGQTPAAKTNVIPYLVVGGVALAMFFLLR